MRRRLENIGPHIIEEMGQRILATESEHTQTHVGYDGHGSLSMDQITVHKRVLDERRDGVDVVLAHLANVLEHEAERLEHTVLNVELGHSILVHEARQDGEGRTSLGNNGDSHRSAHAVLALLHLQVVEQRGQHVMWTDGLGYIAEGVDGRPTNGLLVGLEQLEQLEADSHPFAGGHELGATVGDSAHQLDAVLLHLLVTVLQDGRETGQQVLDGRRHLCHADHIHDS